MSLKRVILLILIVFILINNAVSSTLQSEFRRALQAYHKNSFNETLSILKPVFLKNPNNVQVAYLLGVTNFKLNNWHQTVEILEQLVSTSAKEINLRECYRMIGISYLRQKNPLIKKALDKFLLAKMHLKRNDKPALHFEISYYIGYCFFSLHNYSNAVKPLETAYNLRPQNDKILYWLIWCYFKTDNCDQTLKYSNAYFKLRPKKKDILTLSCKCLIKQHSYNKAKKICQLLITYFPEYSEGYLLNGKLFLFDSNPNIKLAKKMFEKALIFNKYNAFGYYYLSQCYEKQSRFIKAIDEMQHAISLQNQKCNWYFRLAYLFEKLAKKKSLSKKYWSKAIKSIKKGLAICPQNDKIRNHLELIENSL